MKNIPLASNINSEKKFWAWLRPKLPGHVIRIENSVGQGMPDANVCDGGREFWLELKYGHSEVLLRPHQYAWGMRRAAHGGHVFIINYCPRCDEIAIIRYPFPVEKKGKYLAIGPGAKFITIPRDRLVNIESVFV